METEELIELVRKTAVLLVDPGATVQVVTHRATPRLIILIVTSQPGAVIGKRGATIDALREVVKKIGSRMKVLVDLDVVQG